MNTLSPTTPAQLAEVRMEDHETGIAKGDFVSHN
jgi:hypothetical protein